MRRLFGKLYGQVLICVFTGAAPGVFAPKLASRAAARSDYGKTP